MPGKAQAKEVLDPVPDLAEGGLAKFRHFSMQATQAEIRLST